MTFTDHARIDLHLHSTRSDGAFSPEVVIQKAAEAGLDLIALTDHDLATQSLVGEHCFGDRIIQVLGGAEISGVHKGQEFHLLVYFPGDVPTVFQEFCRSQCQERAARYDAARAALDFADLPAATVDAHLGQRAMTRLHLAQALVEGGHAGHLGEAFGRWLGDRHANVPKLSLPFVEAIEVARRNGGLTSWAHPTIEQAEAHLAEFAAAGLTGLEVLRPHLDNRVRYRLRRLATRHGLFLTGGSDWHGWGDARLGLFRMYGRELGDFRDALRAA